MGIPTEVTGNGFHAVVTPASPTLVITSSQFQSLLQSTWIGDIRKQTVFTTVLNVTGTSVIGGNHRQTARSSLQQGESERLRQSRIHEQSATAGRPAVEGRHLSPAVLLGVGHLAIEIETIHQIKHLLKHIPLLLLQLAGVLTTTQHQHQVVPLTQHRRLSEGLHQRRNVLATDSTGNRQKWWTIRIPEKRLQQALKSGSFLSRAVRMETCGIHARGHHLGLLRSEMAVAGVLLLRFLRRAGDHQIRLR